MFSEDLSRMMVFIDEATGFVDGTRTPDAGVAPLAYVATELAGLRGRLSELHYQPQGELPITIQSQFPSLSGRADFGPALEQLRGALAAAIQAQRTLENMPNHGSDEPPDPETREASSKLLVVWNLAAFIQRAAYEQSRS